MSAVFVTIMKAKQTKPKKKPTTPDDFAVLIQNLAPMATKDDLNVIREEMATKNDLERLTTKEELATTFSTPSDRISAAKDELQEQIA
jgi:hypothetical protein